MKRRITIILLSLVLVGSLGGIAAVALDLLGGSVRPYVNPPPWEKGKPLTPRDTHDNPQLISVARAQQIEEWIKTRELSPNFAEGYVRWSPELSFAETERRGGDHHRKIPAGLVAGQTVSGTASESEQKPQEHADIGLQIQLYASTEARDRALEALAREGQEDQQKTDRQALPAPPVAGASNVRMTQISDSCTHGGYDGQLDTVKGSAAVGAVTLVTTRLSCFATGHSAMAVKAVTASLTKAVDGVTGLEDEPVPAQLFDRTDDYPVISSGSWADKQIVVDESLGAKGRLVLPSDIPATGVEAFIDGRDTVVVMDSEEGAKGFLRSELTSSDRAPATEQVVDDADQQVCREGKHYREATTCWTRLGRFVVITRSGEGDDPGVEDQIDLLRQ